MRWVENYNRERGIGERQRPEISDNVWTDNQAAIIAKGVLLGADVSEYGALVMLVEPEQAGSTTHVNNRFVGHLCYLPDIFCNARQQRHRWRITLIAPHIETMRRLAGE
jgi:hypothetical protein